MFEGDEYIIFDLGGDFVVVVVLDDVWCVGMVIFVFMGVVGGELC